MKWLDIVLLAMMIIASIIIGFSARGLYDKNMKHILNDPVMSYGFDESKNVWNRIRVNEYGYVICAKE